ncbi:O-antigen ligase family protein [Clostridium sp. 1001275B_160808_H3]|uniref:O-antigen ligase family protein n=1 Tax=Clostridium sp. 1001275B_160808_H3 TaxID=2787110 RepID=UPI0018982C50|nr:O-antigen ligase family protein [Clostridium sp. 1001275B_160808_H3]
MNKEIMKFFAWGTGFVWNSGKITLRFVGLMGETNSYAQVGLLLISLLIVLMFQKKEKKYAIINLLIIIIITMFCFETYSKMFILGVGIVMFVTIFYILYEYVVKRKKIKVIYVMLVITILLIILLVSNINKILQNSMVQNYLIRFSVEDISTGRGGVYQHFIDIIASSLKYILFGIGFEKYNSRWELSVGISGTQAHSLYLEHIVLFGVILSSIMILGLINIIMKMRKENESIIFLPLIALLSTGVVLHGIGSNYFYFCLFLVLDVRYSKLEIDREGKK